jgi:putative membrane protein
MTRFRLTQAVAAGAVIVAAVSLRAQSGTAADASTFVESMAKAAMAEVVLGRLAVQRASDAEVKSFGQTMIDEHSAAHEELLLLGEQLNVLVPKAPDEAARGFAERLSSLRDADFDREYINAMVQRHTEAAAKLKPHAQPGDGGTPVGTSGRRAHEQAIAQWAAKALPAVQKHLERARELQQKVR